MTVSRSNFNTSSEDAKIFAPCSFAAETDMNNSIFTGIALAMSVLLCLAPVNVLSIYGIITGLVILDIFLWNKYEKAKN